MVNCCVPFCTSNGANKKSRGINLHEFPSCKERRQQWIRAISRQGDSKDKLWQPTSDRSSICSLHFKESDFREGLKIRKLRLNAVPSVFDCYPVHKQPEKPKERRIINKVVVPVSTPTSKRRKRNSETNEDAKEADLVTILVKEQVSANATEVQLEKSARESEVQTKITSRKIKQDRIKFRSSKRTCQRQQSRIYVLFIRNRTLVKENALLKKKVAVYNIDAVESAANDGSVKAKILMEQLKTFNKIKPRWSELTVRYCILWQSKSPAGYRFARQSKLLSLPSKATLQRYVGSTSGEHISMLITKRLEDEAAKLSELKRIRSLILDEMSIKPQAKYMRNNDEMLGYVDINGMEQNLYLQKKLATSLLCFVFVGLCSHFRIPVAYFFTANIKASDLQNLTLHVIDKVEKTNFTVQRIVADNHATNVKLFSGLCKSINLQPQIQHPFDNKRVLFLSFDLCHILKNFWSLLMSQKRCMQNEGKLISGEFIRKLYKLQRNMVIKPVRRLTYKHVFPTSMEKMNVGRSVDVFSREVITALKYLQKYGPQFGLHDFVNAEGTIEFLEIVNRWFTILNVKNTTYHIHSRNPDAMHFFSVDDERLDWLENNFLNYLHRWKSCCTDLKVEFLSEETHSAACLTTQSAVECVRFLLNNGFQYVLTRKFTSDEIESLFSSIRQLSGFNDQTDAVSVRQALHKILRTGLVASSLSGNVKSLPCSEWMSELSLSLETLVPNSTLEPTTTEDATSKPEPASKVISIEELKTIAEPHSKYLQYEPTGTLANSVSSASTAYVAGYLVRVIEDHMDCTNCHEKVSTASTLSPSMSLVRGRDLGGYDIRNLYLFCYSDDWNIFYQF